MSVNELKRLLGEPSRNTVYRDIEFMQNRLVVPIYYVQGYSCAHSENMEFFAQRLVL